MFENMNLDLRELMREIVYGFSYTLYIIRCKWYERRLTRVLNYSGRCFSQLEKRNGAQPPSRVLLKREQRLNLEIIKTSGESRWLRMKLNYLRLNHELRNKDLETDAQKSTI